MKNVKHDDYVKPLLAAVVATSSVEEKKLWCGNLVIQILVIFVCLTAAEGLHAPHQVKAYGWQYSIFLLLSTKSLKKPKLKIR